MDFAVTATLLKMGVWLGVILNVTPIMLWLERRGGALIQDRPGPNRVGPLGLFQALADVVKFLCKEDVTPTEVDRPLYLLAPVIALIPSLTVFIVIPFGPTVTVGGNEVPLVVTTANTGVLLLLALSSLGVYSLVLAGYSSNNKYSLLGAVRAAAQMISYELALTLAVVAVLVPVGTFRLDAVVEAQQGAWLGFLPAWNVFPQILGFLVFLVAAFAETNRLPFDLPEAESELVAGYSTEYSAMRFALFFMGEYQSMAVLSALAATLYFGGWYLPGLDYTGTWWVVAAKGLGVLIAKMGLFLLLFVWVRWTFPRFRFDQLMRLGWKVLLPVALFNLVLVAVMTLSGWL